MAEQLTRDRFPSEDAELWSVGERDAPMLEGQAVTYRETPNYSGRIVVPGAFTDSLTRRPTAEKPMQMGYEHSSFSGTNIVGKWSKAKDTKQGIVVSDGQIFPTSQGRDAQVLVDAGVITGLSIGFLPIEVKHGRPGETYKFPTPFGTRTYELETDAMFVLKGELMETSLVGSPADDDARLHRHGLTALAARALPGLRDGAEWETTAYSMALLMGGRGAGRSFRDLPELERSALYLELAANYQAHEKTPPEFDPDPDYAEVEFHHDEREIFQQRYTAKTGATYAAGLAGLEGPLSREGCAMLQKVARAALPLLASGPLTEEGVELAREMQAVLGPQLEDPYARLKTALGEVSELVDATRKERDA